ncbi:D-lactate dehydrogenase [Limihaloglobus sulfuriphilus]|uniref:D-lactate dehydrogenase n=1 Tax=Limihaloglobus sulfuriphilus TaxID=1851148 RepID=A0A1Q2MEB9_9BACT|nr:2-hydroxyacid dehydrogenase [Limihaloglobus sulfuriphilus]AQQ70602.1 D-lactate dehydrogenase [Limihaloglobus sulfuriphilus]
MTNPKKIAFFDAKPYDKRSFDEVNKDYGFDINYFDAHLDENTVELSQGFDGVCAFVNDTLNKNVIDHLNEHKIGVIGLRCAGYNNVDFKAAYGKIHVLRVPAYSPYAVAEHAAALILALNRKTHRAYYRTRDANFSINGLMGFDLHGKTAGIVGTGKIGKCLISILKGFGMRVLAYDKFPDKDYAEKEGINYVSFEELASKSDIISLHCPLNEETEWLINKESINRMKDGVILINTGRGKLIDTQALIDGLKSGKIGSAGLDVYEEENQYFFEDRSAEVISDDVLARLLMFPNVLVTSHQGFFTKEAVKNIAETTLGNFKEYFEGGYLKNEICYKCDQHCRKKDGKRCF